LPGVLIGSGSHAVAASSERAAPDQAGRHRVSMASTGRRRWRGGAPRALARGGAPSGPYGPRVQATGALSTGAYRLSKRTTPQRMEEVVGVPMSVGPSSPWEPATTAAVAAPVEAARRYVQAQEVAQRDETSWRQGDKRAWLWVAVTRWGTGVVGRRSRGGQGARGVFGGG